MLGSTLEHSFGSDELCRFHINFRSLLTVEPVIGHYTVGHGITSGNQGSVVDVGYRGHHRLATDHKPLSADLLQVRRRAMLLVLWIKAVYHHDHCRLCHCELPLMPQLLSYLVRLNLVPHELDLEVVVTIVLGS